jgi:hypothetical protein
MKPSLLNVSFDPPKKSVHDELAKPAPTLPPI